jgi:diguanylate cyclase
MSENSERIDPANPTQVARETLRRLALRRIAPTPDNYQALYTEITGMPASPAPGAVGVLGGLVADLNQHHPELAEPVRLLNQALQKSDWPLCRKQLGKIALQLKYQNEHRSGANQRPQTENLALLRDSLAKTLEFGVVAQLNDNPRLAEKARQIATAIRTADSAASLNEATAALKSLWISLEMQANDAGEQQETLKRILVLLLENIGELLDDDLWLRGQLELVQDVIAGPLKIQSLQEAERRLKEIIYKQSLVKHGLREATTTLKATMTTFVSRMSDVVAANDEYQSKIATHMARISQTEDVLELNHILESLLDETRAAQSDTRRAHDDLIQERDAAVRAESRIRQLETQLAQMSALVREDPLTHSLNRRGLEHEFAREAARADRYQTAFSIAVLDIDNFKALNDKRGHHAGDAALIHLVSVIREELRITDQVARLGGEEFLIMLPNTRADEAVKIITRLQRSLTKKYFLDRNEHVLITFSAGVAERHAGELQEALVERADNAMYEAKRTGKNRVCLAAGSSQPA